MRFDGQVAFITGAAQGIGRASALRLGSEGATIVVVDVNLAGAEATVELLKEENAPAMAVQADITKYDQVCNGVEQALSAFGKIDILCNIAGMDHKAPVWLLEEKDWDRVLNLNLKGTWFMCKAVVPGMIERQYGRIINISSMAGISGEAFTSPYCASKFGVIGFTQCLALEVGKYNITANCVCPGPTQGPLIEQAIRQGTERTGETFEQYAQRMYLGQTPLGRFAYGEDIAGAIAFLASDDGKFITGAHLNVSGGREMH